MAAIFEASKYIADFCAETYPDTEAGQYSFAERAKDALENIRRILLESGEEVVAMPEIPAVPQYEEG